MILLCFALAGCVAEWLLNMFIGALMLARSGVPMVILRCSLPVRHPVRRTPGSDGGSWGGGDRKAEAAF